MPQVKFLAASHCTGVSEETFKELREFGRLFRWKEPGAYYEEYLPRTPLSDPTLQALQELDTRMNGTSKQPTSTTRPQHYGGVDNLYEAIKVIEAWDLNFNLGNAVKYINRLGKKELGTEVVDLEKAVQYLQFEIARRKRLV